VKLRRAAICLSAMIASLGTGTAAYASWSGAGAGSGAVTAAQL
jgi:hypothetical protein